MPMKAPAIQLYVKDWKADTDGLSLAAKGAWIQVICTAHLADKRGKVSRPLDQWARTFGTDLETAKAVLLELSQLESARVTFGRKNVTVTSRRMETERKIKEADRLRKRKQRASGASPEKVTPYTAYAVTASAQQPPLPPNLDTPQFQIAWTEWEKHRAEMRHKLTPSTRAKQLKMLAKVGPATAAAMIHQSIEQGWQGLFPLKGDRQQARTPEIGPDTKF